MINQKTGEWSGIFIDLLDELKKKVNFSYSFVANDNSFDGAGDYGLRFLFILYFSEKCG